jgi:hypothetical protein
VGEKKAISILTDSHDGGWSAALLRRTSFEDLSSAAKSGRSKLLYLLNFLDPLRSARLASSSG